MTPTVEPEVLSAYWLRGAELMHQQCWCWGQDVRRPEGNLLLENGFERTRAPEDVSGSFRYWLERNGTRLALWGFGVGCHARRVSGVTIVLKSSKSLRPRLLADPPIGVADRR